MFANSFRQVVAAAAATVFFAASFSAAQDHEPILKITRPSVEKEQRPRTTTTARLDRETAFNRLHPVETRLSLEKRRTRQLSGSIGTSSLLRSSPAVSALEPLSFGTGGGDANEAEPNNPDAQAVSLPINLFGEIRVDSDVDFFTFQAFAGQQITIEPFAARLRRSNLIADIAIYNSSGQVIDSRLGDENNDPVIRFTPVTDQVLIVGITDADDLGGRNFDYILNITRGLDIDEQEPNGREAQSLDNLPVTVFGGIELRDDVDFFSFTATAGQTLIVDADAEVLGSLLDAEINLSDPATGTEFFYNDQNDGDDPRLNIVLPYTGRYVIGIGAFNSNSSGFYRLNVSIVSSVGAPLVSSVAKLSKKLIEVSGEGFGSDSTVEVNGVARSTTVIDSRTLRAKVKAKPGQVVTVTNTPDKRRSNPVLVQ